MTLQPPDVLIPWLNWQHSLTTKLRQQTGAAQLHLICHDWAEPNWWDTQVLHLKERALVRKIIIVSGEVMCWFARTVIPQSTYQANPSFFNRLQTETLGQLIFNEPKVKRLELVHYPIDSSSIEYHWLDIKMMNNEEILWVRKSTFAFEEHSRFFLVEIFLPGLLTFLKV